MKHGKFDGNYGIPENGEIFNGYRLFMLPKKVARAVVCPTSELVIIETKDMISAYMDLQSWGLNIDPSVLNQ